MVIIYLYFTNHLYPLNVSTLMTRLNLGEYRGQQIIIGIGSMKIEHL